MTHPFTLVGHRGAPAHEVENTARSFLKAFQCGATAVEFDVRRTLDGIPVVFHDESLQRLAGRPGLVEELPYPELYRVRLPGGARIPTLHEVYAIAKGRGALDIELKTPGVEEDVVQGLEEYQLTRDALVTSFLPWPLAKVAQTSQVQVGLLLEGWDDEALDVAADIGAAAILPSHEAVTQDVVDKAHARGLRLITWTVDDPGEAARLLALGVDGIITDDPCLLRPIVLRQD